MTQLEELKQIVKGMPPSSGLRIRYQVLADLVGRAQNPRPDGEADGTINPELWQKVRDVNDAMLRFADVIQDLWEDLL